MKKQICTISGESFEVSDLEIELRGKFGFTDLPKTAPWVRFRELGAFWPHWNLHNRKCDTTGQNIISIFSEKCPYPVWTRTEWLENNNPSDADIDFSRDFFEQAWELFQKCPIPHKTGTGNENCDYSDDWWYSKNSYLCHSGYESEDVKYCYRSYRERDCNFDTFSSSCELCLDLINCFDCFDSKYLLNSKNIQDSAFLYDCRSCSDCMFCFNLRNKKYCFGNKQLTKDEYETKKVQWNLKSREIYDKAKVFFADMMKTRAWHRNLEIDISENCSGNYLVRGNNLENCFFLSHDSENCVNNTRGGVTAKNILDGISNCVNAELIYYSTLSQFNVYEHRFCVSCTESSYMDYSMYCFQCEQCFGCCGLVGKKYHIFNKPYSPEEYVKTREKIIEHMKKTGEWGEFFPGYFAPNSYDESWSGYHFPMKIEEQKKSEFRLSEISERKNNNYLDVLEIPNSVDELDTEKEEWLVKQIFWDEKYKKPFQITQADINFSRKMSCPLPNSYYMRRIKENFAWMPFDGKLRDCVCGKCAKKTQTSWSEEYNSRIICEECYLDILN